MLFVYIFVVDIYMYIYISFDNIYSILNHNIMCQTVIPLSFRLNNFNKNLVCDGGPALTRSVMTCRACAILFSVTKKIKTCMTF